MDFYELLALGAVAVLTAGVVKGLSGIGLPTASITLLTLTLDPRTAIALILAPIVVTNAWQVWRMGETRRAMRDYGPFAIVLAIGVFLTSVLAAKAPDRLIFSVLGVAIVAFAIVNLSIVTPALPQRYDLPAQILLGVVAGVLGGLSGVWAAPLVVYLAARRTPKDEFVRATGLLVFAGSLPLCLGYLQQGLLTRESAVISMLLIAPTLLGFTLGEWLRNRLSGEGFRKAFLVVFLLMGLNLLRRALM